MNITVYTLKDFLIFLNTTQNMTTFPFVYYSEFKTESTSTITFVINTPQQTVYFSDHCDKNMASKYLNSVKELQEQFNCNFRIQEFESIIYTKESNSYSFKNLLNVI